MMSSEYNTIYEIKRKKEQIQQEINDLEDQFINEYTEKLIQIHFLELLEKKHNDTNRTDNPT